jgi:hypothetical protein
MVVKNREKNRQYVAKSRAKLIARIGIEAYRKKNAEAQRRYRAKLKEKLRAAMAHMENLRNSKK